MRLVGSWLVLLTKPSMFGELEVRALEVVWRFEPITFYIGSLRVKLILAPIYKCTSSLPNMEGFVSKNNQLPTKLMLNQRITLVCSNSLKVLIFIYFV